ncbi:MAG: hypothetical protein ACI4XE_04655 [Acutalibacteraceae bacterium]
MKIAAIVLFVFQVLGLIGSVANGSFSAMGAAQLIGFFVPAIIGIVLLTMAKKREK